MPHDVDYVLAKLDWMRRGRIWPNGLRYLWTDAFGVVLLVSLRDELADVNEQVFDLIQRDEGFYLQLIEPDRGGELTKIKAPTLLEDAG